MSIAIKFENISKEYRLGLVSTRTLSHDLNRWWQINILGNEDPYLKIGEINDRTTKGNSEYVWALRDINFKVNQGEVLGIIGRNGAGKSTLLKILSKVTTPSTGIIKAKGRIASLLEVGTGFHPEMTGRENIYMNGSIMGMNKAEITRKLDEIVCFAGVERYLDTPVKRYSSGMTVRLGFAIAAHLEPEILVVDEVLAVGDAEFQKKAIGKMQDVSRSDGRTVLFVSHNMGSIQALCTQAIILKNGSISFEGKVKDAINQYLAIHQFNEKDNTIENKVNIFNKTIQIDEILVNDSTNFMVTFEQKDNILNIKIIGHLKLPLNISFEAMLYDEFEHLVAMYSPTHFYGSSYNFGNGKFIIEEKIFFSDNITNGNYFLSIRLSQMNIEFLAEINKIIKIVVSKNISPVTGVSFDNSYFGKFLLHK